MSFTVQDVFTEHADEYISRIAIQIPIWFQKFNTHYPIEVKSRNLMFYESQTLAEAQEQLARDRA